jgi:hypothetical protein
MPFDVHRKGQKQTDQSAALQYHKNGKNYKLNLGPILQSTSEYQMIPEWSISAGNVREEHLFEGKLD